MSRCTDRQNRNHKHYDRTRGGSQLCIALAVVHKNCVFVFAATNFNKLLKSGESANFLSRTVRAHGL